MYKIFSALADECIGGIWPEKNKYFSFLPGSADAVLPAHLVSVFHCVNIVELSCPGTFLPVHRLVSPTRFDFGFNFFLGLNF